MSIQEQIQQKITSTLAPVRLDVENESRNHNVPPGSETHFKVLVVSGAFEGMGLVARHRRVHEILAEELKGGVHALSVRAKTPAEWEKEEPGAFASPPCLGGSKADKQPA